MKKIKQFILVGSMALIMGTVSLPALASSYSTPAELAAGLSGRTVDSVVTERMENNKTYGTIAREANVLNEFKSEIITVKKARLNQRVEDGTMSRERANAIIDILEEKQANCDGTGPTQVGKNMQAGFGAAKGMGNGQGAGQGAGNSGGSGQGQGGMGMRNGSGFQN
jgi:hypothetical protein